MTTASPAAAHCSRSGSRDSRSTHTTVPGIPSGADPKATEEIAMSTPSNPNTPQRRDSDDREPRTVVPTPRRPVEDAPDWAPSTHEYYPGVRYALEHLTALRRTRQGDPTRGDRA